MKLTVLFVGGGTMGPVTPLLAVMRRMRAMRPELLFAWAGTPNGPERAVIEAEGISFFAVPIAKVPRYFSVGWFTFPFRLYAARRAAKKILEEVDPVLVASVGGFTSVPVMREARKRGTRCVIHQLDAEPGLANRTVAKWCKAVTTSYAYEIPPFSGVKSEQAPTPCRFAKVEMSTRDVAAKRFGFDAFRPIVFVVGGGTGASSLNHAIWSRQREWLGNAQIIHLCGIGKMEQHESNAMHRYVLSEFFNEARMKDAYAAADLVISRAGIGGISDIAALKKAAIFVPIPYSHQELNVQRLPCDVVRQQGDDFSVRLIEEAKRLLEDESGRERLGQAVHDAFPTDDGSALAKRWLALVP